MNTYFDIQHTPDYVHVAFAHPHRVLSSAVLNGGFVQADHIVNLKVPKNLPDGDALGSPADCIARHCRNRGLSGSCVGMMTAANMDSMRIARYRDQDVEITVIVTAGISNLRRAGDKADYCEQLAKIPEPGTVNTIVISNVAMTGAGMVEATMIAAEAKAAAMQDLALLSPVSKAVATGTGTDAIAVACAQCDVKVTYAGKHTRFGELLAKSVIESTTTSVIHAGDQGQ